MPRKIITGSIFAIIAILVAALGYWNIAPESPLDAQQDPIDDRIDFYIVNARTVQYQSDGKLHYRMTSNKAEHIKATDITLLDQPKLNLFRGTDLPWDISSLRGEVSPGGNEVELIDKVHVTRTDDEGRTSTLTTSRLTVFPDEEYAQTQQAVRISTANGVTTATGMKAYFNDGRVHLLSNVRGQHEVR